MMSDSTPSYRPKVLKQSLSPIAGGQFPAAAPVRDHSAEFLRLSPQPGGERYPSPSPLPLPLQRHQAASTSPDPTRLAHPSFPLNSLRPHDPSAWRPDRVTNPARTRRGPPLRRLRPAETQTMSAGSHRARRAGRAPARSMPGLSVAPLSFHLHKRSVRPRHWSDTPIESAWFCDHLLRSRLPKSSEIRGTGVGVREAEDGLHNPAGPGLLKDCSDTIDSDQKL